MSESGNKPPGGQNKIEGGIIGSLDIPLTSNYGSRLTPLDEIISVLTPVAFAAVMFVTIYLLLAKGNHDSSQRHDAAARHHAGRAAEPGRR